MAARIAWLLNLDAELELQSPRTYRPDARMSARIAELVPKLATLVHAHDFVVGRDAGPSAVDAVLAFCPTPNALARLREAGLVHTHATPDPALLTYLARREFCASLGQTLPGAAYVANGEALAHIIAAPPTAPARSWLIKRDFSFAGRDRLRVDPGALPAAAASFAARSFARGEGLQVEPWCARLNDVSQHGYARADGQLLYGLARIQQCDARGVWRSCTAAGTHDLEEAERAALHHEVERAGVALHALGYVGPFGVDAFRYQGPEGPLFCARCEVNARFTMGYPRSLLLKALGLPHPPP